MRPRCRIMASSSSNVHIVQLHRKLRFATRTIKAITNKSRTLYRAYKLQNSAKFSGQFTKFLNSELTAHRAASSLSHIEPEHQATSSCTEPKHLEPSSSHIEPKHFGAAHREPTSSQSHIEQHRAASSRTKLKPHRPTLSPSSSTSSHIELHIGAH